METIENQQKTEVFDIKKQNVEKLDEKTVEKLQSDFFIGLWRRGIPPILSNNWIWKTSSPYTIEYKQNFHETFKACSEQLKTWLNQNWDVRYLNDVDSIDRRSIYLITIKQAFLKDWSYYFYTSEWQILKADKYDFDQNWLWANSLKFYWNPLSYGDIEGKTSKEIITNNIKVTVWWDWFIHFYEWKGYKRHSLQLPWEKVFQIEPTNILIQNWWKLIQYKIMDWGKYKQWEIFNIPFKWISQMVVDKNRNFLLIVNKTDEWFKLHIINLYDFIKKNEINEIYQIKGVEDVVWLWDDDWMVCMMENWELQYYRNTFSKFKRNFFEKWENWSPAGELIYPKDQKATTMGDSTRSVLKEALESWFSIDYSDEDVVDETDKVDQEIIDKIWEIKVTVNGKESTLKEMFDNANSKESIELVWKIFQKIKKNPQIDKVEWITKSIEEAIDSKKNQIALDFISNELNNIETELEWEPDLSTLITIKNKLKQIRKNRWKLMIWKTNQDETLNKLLHGIDDAIKNYQESNKEEYMEKIEENLLEIKNILDWYDYITSVTKIRTTPIRKETEEMLWLLDSSTKSEYESKMNTLEVNRINELKDISSKEKEEQIQQINKIKSDIKWKIGELKLIFSEVDEPDEIEDLWNSNELVKRINEKIKELPNKDADEILLQLRRTLDDVKYQSMINSADSVWIVRTLDGFWIDTSLYYSEDWSEQVEWDIEWKELPDWKISLILKLINWETHEYDKTFSLKNRKSAWVRIKWRKINFDMTEDEFNEYQSLVYEWKDENKRQEYYDLLKKLRWLQLTGKDKEPDEEKQKVLEKIEAMRKKFWDVIYTEHLVARLIKQQKLNPRSLVPKKEDVASYIVLDEEKEILKTLSARLRCQKKYGWIDILEWWPGLWKTVMCEFLANVTNREIVVVACGRIDPETMIFSPSIDDKNSGWEPANWVALMQKPWTLIVFDEIDKLPPAAVVKLHSLFDTRRSVYHEQMWEVKANPDCLFMGTRNLYDTLSNPIASRARLFRMTYPSLRNEAYKISKYAKDNPVLNMMKYEDFNELYDKYVVRGEPEPKNAKEKKVYQEIINIDKLLQVFTKLRELFSEDAYNYEISYRDAQKVYQDYNNWIDFKTATMNALLRWAWAVTEWDKSEKNEQVETVKAVIDSIM